MECPVNKTRLVGAIALATISLSSSAHASGGNQVYMPSFQEDSTSYSNKAMQQTKLKTKLLVSKFI